MKSKYSNTGKNIKNKNVNQTKKINSKCDKSNPYNLIPFKNINTTKDDFISNFDFVHTFNDMYYIICTNLKYEIIFIDIIDNKIVLKIKNAHTYQIIHIAHYSDEINKRDLFASYCYNGSLKLWNINTFECIAVIDLLSSFGDKLLISLFFMNFKNQLYIVAPYNFDVNFEKVVLYDLKGIKAKEIKIKNKNINVFDINCYYEKKSQKNYFFFGGPGFLKSFDVNKNEIYKIYCNNDEIINCQVLIYDENKIIKLISAGGGMVRIWNFHTGALLNSIKLNNNKYNIPKICIWNNDYLIGACQQYGLKIFDFKNKNVPQTISGFGDSDDVKKIIHPIYGECLIYLTSRGTNVYLLLGINKSAKQLCESGSKNKK